MLYRDIARLGILSSKLHVNAIQSPVHYYQIIKKNFIVATGIEPMTYYFSFFSMIYQIIKKKKLLSRRESNR